MAGREPVLERQHGRSGALRQPAAHPIVGRDAADRPAAAVQVDDQRQGAGRGTVQARGELFDLQIADRVQLRPGRASSRTLRDPLAHGRYVALGEGGRGLRDPLRELLICEWSGHEADSTYSAIPFQRASSARAGH